MRSHFPGLTLAALHALIVVCAAVRTFRPKLRAMPHSAPRASASIIFAQSIPRRAPTATPERPSTMEVHVHPSARASKPIGKDDLQTLPLMEVEKKLGSSPDGLTE